MNRKSFRAVFDATSTVVLPVIHVLDHDQTSRNIDFAVEHGVQGIFLINHDFDVAQFLPIIRTIRQAYPELWIGINFLAVTGKYAFPILAELEKEGIRIDGYWADDGRIDEKRAIDDQPEAKEILEIKADSGWDGLYFGGTAFKKQRAVDEKDFLPSAIIAARWMDVVTTSGIATGEEAGIDKVAVFRQGLNDSALALASGITPENVMGYSQFLDGILVATGINHDDDFYNIDPLRLEMLMSKIRRKS